eukprot:5380804-Prymnesium_polylepis.1
MALRLPPSAASIPAAVCRESVSMHASMSAESIGDASPEYCALCFSFARSATALSMSEMSDPSSLEVPDPRRPGGSEC